MKPTYGVLHRVKISVQRVGYGALLCMICAASPPVVCQAQNQGQILTISKVDRNDVIDDVSQKVLEDAYRKLGITLVFKELPATRALAESSEGLVDGEFQRRGGLGATYPDLIQVKVPINWLDICVFTQSVHFTPHGWDSLRPYRIGFHRGIVAIEEGTKGMNIDPADTNELVMRKLLAGRTDIAVMTSIDGQDLLKQMNEKSIQILMPPLAHVQLYHYLNKKNADIAVKLEKVLRSMEADGTIASIRRRIFADAGVHD